ncbi:flagellar motor stator protein MotA [Methylobacterium sp. Leaf469]|uniref:flagellar motor stator protein MotA n=1 Tax=unclassified Methylobacterium TaxID=2615210 RepID=UPI0006FB2259|nr:MULTISPECIES: flagellar motor stator protein MotA [unclassified Methylobacterium]KQP36793.1 flagellar motor stator protein MotA [Methylobacterium sp. Leaf100]KQU05476.1 flagellar motor stator protein MotA [Methylobacterium sp. Leaf469]USU33492.1 flagellar motor stator protein MotA [Methylobacterium sp. OTU13CASTA1]
MGIVIGLVIGIGCMLGGFVAMGGHLEVLWQPWEFVIIGGMGAGAFVMANPMKTVVDSGKASMDALTGKVPKRKDYLELLGLLHALMRELKAKPRNEVEPHLDDPANSELFKAYPAIAKNADLVLFICDYARLILIGNARAHEIEALMDEEINGYRKDRLKPYGAVTMVAEAMPALGIVAAVLGIVKAMGALDQSPQILGGLIGAALVGTFFGVFMSYGVLAPFATKIKVIREKQAHVYIIVKQSLLAYMSGAVPQIAVEHGRKGISLSDRPTIDEVENATVNGGAQREAA